MTTDELIYLLCGMLNGAALTLFITGRMALNRARRTAAEIKAMVEQADS